MSINREFIFAGNMDYLESLCPDLHEWQQVQLAEDLTRRDVRILELYNELNDDKMAKQSSTESTATTDSSG